MKARPFFLLSVAVLAASSAAAERAAKRSATPTRTATASVRPTPTPLGPGERISLDLKDADLVDLLRTFATLVHLNLAVDPDVHGSVTLRLDDVPWEKALELILHQNGYGYVLEGSVLRVGKPEKLVGPPRRL